MRTTITFADDVAAAIEAHRRDHHVGVSDAVNELIRDGLARPKRTEPFVQRTYDMGEPIMDLSNIGEVEEMMDRLDHD